MDDLKNWTGQKIVLRAFTSLLSEQDSWFQVLGEPFFSSESLARIWAAESSAASVFPGVAPPVTERLT